MLLTFEAISVVAALLLGYISWKCVAAQRKRWKLEYWADKSFIRREPGGIIIQKKVILHGMYGNSQYLPSVSPFVLKLETYLRFANIPYEIDKEDVWGEKGKTPWVTFGGEHYADSQFIVEKLFSQFGTPGRYNYSKEEKALGTAARVMVEEHLYWTGLMWRFAFGGRDTLQQVLNKEKTLKQWLIFSCIAPPIKSMAWSQGIGRHTESQVISLMLQDLQALSSLLGDKRFFLGEEPSTDDCAIFGGLASAVFVPGGPPEVQKELKGELSNLSEYCWRMQERFWPDWGKLIQNPKN